LHRWSSQDRQRRRSWAHEALRSRRASIELRYGGRGSYQSLWARGLLTAGLLARVNSVRLNGTSDNSPIHLFRSSPLRRQGSIPLMNMDSRLRRNDEKSRVLPTDRIVRGALKSDVQKEVFLLRILASSSSVQYPAAALTTLSSSSHSACSPQSARRTP